MVGKRTMEHMDVVEADFPPLLGERTDAKNNLVHHRGCIFRDSEFFGSATRVPSLILEKNTDLPLFAAGGPFQEADRIQKTHVSDGSDRIGSHNQGPGRA